ncbi:MAG: disulfide reductase, partial [Candidatus Aureabacteria bacterium]|nr:disulfide reductase [Candidatus Auribacterota bacterium]
MEEVRIGVYICNCGTNIAKVVDCDAIRQCLSKMPNVVVARTYKYMCSNPGQEMIVENIRKHDLNRVVVAACSPRMHERTFRKALQNGGINPYFFDMANIREQCSWVHEDHEAATAKALAVTKAAVLRVAHHEPLEKLYADMCPSTLVLGAGIAGLSAA